MLARICVTDIATLLTLALPLAQAPAQSTIHGWGIGSFDTEVMDLPISRFVSGGPGCYVNAAIRADGRLFVWGSTAGGSTALPAALLTNPVVTAAIDNTGVALMPDGSLAQWGRINVPPPPRDPNAPFTAVAAGWDHALALRSNGTIVAWGGNDQGQLQVPDLPRGKYFTSVFATNSVSGALVNDGSARFWGRDTGEFSATVPNPPPGRRYSKIVFGALNVLLLRDDGTLLAFGDNSVGQSTIPTLPPGVTFVDVAAASHSLGLLSNGRLLAWGSNPSGQCNVPPLPSGMSYLKIAANI
jgi:hypothetical protein